MFLNVDGHSGSAEFFLKKTYLARFTINVFNASLNLETKKI